MYHILSSRVFETEIQTNFINFLPYNNIFIASVVAQYYEADVNKEHVIRGNAAIIKCLIPSFVADFVDVVSWHTDQDDSYYPSTDYGSFMHSNKAKLCFVTFYNLKEKCGFFFNNKKIFFFGLIYFETVITILNGYKISISTQYRTPINIFQCSLSPTFFLHINLSIKYSIYFCS